MAHTDFSFLATSKNSGALLQIILRDSFFSLPFPLPLPLSVSFAHFLFLRSFYVSFWMWCSFWFVEILSLPLCDWHRHFFSLFLFFIFSLFRSLFFFFLPLFSSRSLSPFLISRIFLLKLNLWLLNWSNEFLQQIHWLIDMTNNWAVFGPIFSFNCLGHCELFLLVIVIDIRNRCVCVSRQPTKH